MTTPEILQVPQANTFQRRSFRTYGTGYRRRSYLRQNQQRWKEQYPTDVPTHLAYLEVRSPPKRTNNAPAKNSTTCLQGWNLGVLDNTFLPEIVFAGQRPHGFDTHTKPQATEEFPGFLTNIKNDNAQLEYAADVFRLQVIIAAKLSTRLHGTVPYVDRAKNAASQNMNSIYART